MEAELQSLRDNHVYEIAPITNSVNLVGCKWVLKIKYHADGSIWKFKARLVAQGFTQQEGIDYDETFAPVMSRNALMILLTLGAHYDYEIANVDVCTAYLNAPIDKEIHMRIPEGSGLGNSDTHCIRLKRALYGLKQSGHLWHKELSKALTQLEWKPTVAEPCLFYRTVNGEQQFLSCYVDDILIATQTPKSMNIVKKEIAGKFKIDDPNDLTEILGIRVTRDRCNKKIYLDQELKINRLLEEMMVDIRKKRETPLYYREVMTPNESQADIKTIRNFQSLVGSLLHITRYSRPDISFAVNALGRHASNPSEQHILAAQRVLAYLNGTRQSKLMIDGSGELKLWGVSDADHAGDSHDSKSISGHIVYLGNTPIDWRSKNKRLLLCPPPTQRQPAWQTCLSQHESSIIRSRSLAQT